MDQLITIPRRLKWLTNSDLAFEFLAPIGLLIMGGVHELWSAFALGVVSFALLVYRRGKRR
jgi:hypothetical protein